MRAFWERGLAVGEIWWGSDGFGAVIGEVMDGKLGGNRVEMVGRSGRDGGGGFGPWW